MRERIFQIVQRARPGDRASHAYDVFIVVVAFLSIVPLMFRPQDAGPELTRMLNLLDVVTVYVLFFDYLMRWATHDLRTGKTGWKQFAKYPFTPFAIIDLLAILPSLGVLPETFKFLRVLRVTKIFRYSRNLTIVANVFRAERKTLLSVLVVALMYIFISGLVMFVNEPDTFDNFFDSLYWATTALTTVGYGDVYPVTDLGKFISMVSSLFGIAIIALPAGIITGGYLEQIRRSQESRETRIHAEERRRQSFRVQVEKPRPAMRSYAKTHRKTIVYAIAMAACFLLNEALYAASSAFGTPLWLDTTGTALAAILLEPVAGLVIAFANNLIQAVQFGDAGNMLYCSLGALAAVVFGTLFARGKSITLRSVGWAALLLVGVGGAISCLLAFWLNGGQLSTPAQQLYYGVLGGWGLSGAPAVVAALLLDRLLDTAAVLVLVVLASRVVEGSRLDPQRWLGPRAAAAAQQGGGQGERAEGASGEAADVLPGSPVPDGGTLASADRYVVGLDVGGSRTKAGVFTLAGDLVGSHVFASHRVLADGTHALLSQEVQTLLEQASVDARCVDAVGLAVPGAVSAEESLKFCPNLDLDLRSYKAFLHSLFPQARVVAMNDANAAVLGDRWRGTSQDREGGTIAFVTLGTGVGAGIIMEGQIYAGVHGGAGELGHLCVNPSEDEPCTCGRTGCMDQYASATGLVNAARKEFARRGADASAQAGAQAALEAYPDARAVLEAAARRDPAARTALARFSDALGFGLAQMACLVDPDLIVLGGGLSERADLYLESVRARYRACALSTCRETPIVVSTLGNECGIYGAARSALDALAEDEEKSRA